MSRSCKTCQHLKRPRSIGDWRRGKPAAQVARDYELAPSSLHRHRTNCLRLGSSNSIMKAAARGSATAALLPSKETLGASYFELTSRIDEIIAQARLEGDSTSRCRGLNSIRHTLDSLARLDHQFCRFSVIGQLLAAPPAEGELKAAITALAGRTWQHPTTGEARPHHHARRRVLTYAGAHFRVQPLRRARIRRRRGPCLARAA